VHEIIIMTAEQIRRYEIEMQIQQFEEWQRQYDENEEREAA
jgi:hypothetical protein